MTVNEYRPQPGERRTFVAASPAFAAGTDTPRAFLERCIERIEAREASVRAFVVTDLDGARAAADESTARWSRGAPLSPLDGCPVGVKDIIHTLGLPTQMNSPLYRGWVAPADAAGVAALRAAGAVIVGKTQTTEFAVGKSPPTTNPWHPGRTPGGSSSGSAAAVGCGMLPLALGTQTVGSILRPASFCGAVGFKPSHGALPTGGLHPLSRTLDHLGPIAASVEDAWAAVRIMQHAFGGDAGGALAWVGELAHARAPTRLARLNVNGDAGLEAGAARAFEDFVDGLRARGVVIADAKNDGGIAEMQRGIDEANDLCMTIMRYEMRWPLGEYALRGDDAVGDRVRQHLAAASVLDAHAYHDALVRRETLRAQVRRLGAQVDGFVLPAASGGAPDGLEFTGERTMLAPWSVVGGPAWSLPLLAVGGMPFGVQLAGMPGADTSLAAVARWLMQ